MATDLVQMEQIAGQVQAALETADLAGYRELLDPNVTWGAPDDMKSGCQNRDQVLTWYRRGWAKGVRANVTETIVHSDKILVVSASSTSNHLRSRVTGRIGGRF